MEGQAADILHALAGPDEPSITWWQMTVRAVVVFVFGIALVRLAGRRAFGRNAALDIITSVVLGSMLSRAITGNAPLFGTLVAAAVLVLLHYLLATIALRSETLGRLVKGGETQLIRDGGVDRAALHRSRLTDHDLVEALRLNGAAGPGEVEAAFLERSGQISVVKRNRGSRNG
jgi:uncharacterized membrane protein YcaP (DUF421 family)